MMRRVLADLRENWFEYALIAFVIVGLVLVALGVVRFPVVCIQGAR